MGKIEPNRVIKTIYVEFSFYIYQKIFSTWIYIKKILHWSLSTNVTKKSTKTIRTFICLWQMKRKKINLSSATLTHTSVHSNSYKISLFLCNNKTDRKLTKTCIIDALTDLNILYINAIQTLTKRNSSKNSKNPFKISRFQTAVDN